MPLEDDAWLLSPPSSVANNNNNTNEQAFKEDLVLTDKNSIQLCQACHMKFSLVIRKHNCKVCGQVFCGKCSCVVHIVKANHRKSSKKQDQPISSNFRKAESLHALSLKLLGIRVCNSCQEIDNATDKFFLRKRSKPLNKNCIINKTYSPLSTKSPYVDLDNKENIGAFHYSFTANIYLNIGFIR